MKTLTRVCAMALLTMICAVGEVCAASRAGYSGVNLNIRSGPNVRFPAVGVLGAGSELVIHGCLARYTWCDVSVSGMRGWASGAHIQFVHEERRVYVPAYAAQVEIPIITFDVTNYWGEYYRDYSFYHDLDHWSSYHWDDDGLPPGWRDNWDGYYDGNEY
ncbi:SH3 domain-containing protein [Bradyrhizobium sp. CB82]|uniref:SH3 domain-containing protein n=1 Tax=Bradyrhizobium sp. CB82 TaxID=3039159 RepID=UPI0024B1EC73|nr:SH3 domain-containing protein [Bradyrhizobium sp. CB82]WFU38881.1 SH3 domain-containing protein [Bradyrhizobium sp. CB82]